MLEFVFGCTIADEDDIGHQESLASLLEHEDVRPMIVWLQEQNMDYTITPEQFHITVGSEDWDMWGYEASVIECVMGKLVLDETNGVIFKLYHPFFPTVAQFKNDGFTFSAINNWRMPIQFW